jgi:hypothetical protein
VGVIISEDARRCIGLLQYNPSTLEMVLFLIFFVFIGPGKDMWDSTRIIAERQFLASRDLLEDTAGSKRSFGHQQGAEKISHCARDCIVLDDFRSKRPRYHVL